MRVLLLSLISLLGLVTGPLAADPLVEELQRTNTLLQAELKLARSGNPYLLIDLQAGQLVLKASGQSLQAWPIVASRQWGHLPTQPDSTLEGKSSLDQPEREVQKVKAVEEGEDVDDKPFKALELSDMPKSYRLHLENGTEISVRPAPEGLFSRLYGLFAVPAWYLTRPMVSSWNFLRNSPYNELALSLSDHDARKLYWAFGEGTPCLIRLAVAGKEG